MNRFGERQEEEEIGKVDGLTRLQLSLEIQEQIRDYIAQGGRIQIVGRGECKDIDLTSWTSGDDAIKARARGTKNSVKLRLVK